MEGSAANPAEPLAAHEQTVVLTFKWNGKELSAAVKPNETVAGLKRVLEHQTSVMAKKQKLLGLKTLAGKPATDETVVSELSVKPNQKLMLLGTAEATLQALAVQEVQPGVQAHGDLDDDLDDVGPLDLALRPEVEEKLRRRIAQAVIKTHSPPRPGKKCAVLDIDYTIFALDSFSENPAELARPHLHSFLAAIYAHYDIVIWSATGMKWIDVKLKELGVSNHPDYRITACMDYTAMVTVEAPGHGRAVFDCKPLRVLWERFPEHYNQSNTIMLDDLRRNYVLNMQQGLVIRPFKKAMTKGKGDRELLKLKLYFLKIAQLESLEGLNHDKWERYVKEELRRLDEEGGS